MKVQASFDMEVRLITIGYILQQFFGEPTTTGAGPYVHTFIARGTMPDGFQMEAGARNATTPYYLRHKGLTADTLKMTVTDEGLAVCTVGVTGMAEYEGDTALDATLTEVSEDDVSLTATTIEEGGATAANIISVEFTLSNFATAGYRIGNGVNAKYVSMKQPAATGTLIADLKDLTLFEKAVNRTESIIDFTLTDGTNTLQCVFPEIDYMRKGIPITSPDEVQVSLPWEAFIDDGADETVAKFILTNTQASYANAA